MHFLSMEKYSRGRRGAPAKGVGRETGARVQIPPSPPKTDKFRLVSFYFLPIHSSLFPEHKKCIYIKLNFSARKRLANASLFFYSKRDLKPSAGYRQEGDVCDRCLRQMKGAIRSGRNTVKASSFYCAMLELMFQQAS